MSDYDKNRLLPTIILFWIVFWILAIIWVANAATARLTWDANIESDLMGYSVYFGTQPRNYSNTIWVGNVTQFDVPNLSSGQTYYFAVTAKDFSGNESGFSNEASIFFEATQPPPQQVKTPPIPEVQLSGTDTTKVDTVEIDNASQFKIRIGIPPVYSDGTEMNPNLVDQIQIDIADVTGGWTRQTIMINTSNVQTQNLILKKNNLYNINARLFINGQAGSWPQATEYFKTKDLIILTKKFIEILFNVQVQQ